MKLLIAGAGGHGTVVADAAFATQRFSEIAFLDDDSSTDRRPLRYPIVGTLIGLSNFDGIYGAFAAALGDGDLRLSTLRRARALGFALPAIMHPNSIVSRDAQIEDGCVVLAGAVINPGARIGFGCIINTGATVDHDCVLGEGVHICPGAHLGGDVAISDRTWFGIGAIAKQGIRIGFDVIVGAGAVCVSDVRDGVTVVGIPAREHKR